MGHPLYRRIRRFARRAVQVSPGSRERSVLRSSAVKSPLVQGCEHQDLLEALQAYMRSCADQRYESVRISPFTAYFHPFDGMVYLNYAIPDAGASGDLSESVEKLRAVCRARERTPRFEYIRAL